MLTNKNQATEFFRSLELVNHLIRSQNLIEPEVVLPCSIARYWPLTGTGRVVGFQYLEILKITPKAAFLADLPSMCSYNS
jgi:hypothetical protein